jgi:hypothetical protein
MFTIQLGHPKINTITPQEFKTVKEVFLKLFYIDEESTFLFWNQIPIQIEYNQDLYSNFDNILAMCWLLQKEVEGKTSVTLTNTVLKINFYLFWHEDELKIEVHFEALKDEYIEYAIELNKTNLINISKTEFLNEWNTLLHQIITAFNAGNVTIEDSTERRKLEMLHRAGNEITGYGKLYVK